MKPDWDEIDHQLQKRTGGRCENCGRPGTQRHHCLIHNLKRLKGLDTELNLMWCCADCHITKKLLDSFEVKQLFWNRQVNYYGLERMRGFIDSVNEQVKIPYKF